VASRPEPEVYNRPISADDWMLLGAFRGQGTHIQLAVEGDGTIDPAALTAAVAAVGEACPGTRLVHRGLTWVDSGRPPAVRVADAADFDRERLDSPLLRTPLTCEEKGSSFEVVLLRGTPVTVLFRAHAAVTDGLGAVLWRRQVFRALRGEPLEGTTCRLTPEDVCAEIATTLGVDRPQGSTQAPWEWRSVMGTLPKGPKRPLWRRRTIDGIHPAVTAKIARLVATFAGGNGGPVVIPIDLRQYLPGLRTVGSATGELRIQVNEDDDWTDVDVSMLKAMSEYQFMAEAGPTDLAPLTMPLPLIGSLARWLDGLAIKHNEVIGAKGLCDNIASVSNLGAVDLAEVSTDDFAATSCYSLGSISWSPEINIVECGGRTEVSVAWRGGPGVAGRAEALLDAIQEELSPRAVRVWDGNRTATGTPEQTLTALFAAQCAATPGAPAIEVPALDDDPGHDDPSASASDPSASASAGATVTYAGLAAAAAGVTAVLAAAGIGRGDRVAVIAGRGPAAITAIWGILGAGAAYLPIDGTYPRARITALLTDAAAPAALLEDPAAHRAALPPGCTPIPLAAIAPAPGGCPDRWGTAVQPGDVACVIYTSGSTGTPKGVEIEHRALANYTRWATREASAGPATRMPLIASLSFDMAGCAIYLPLLSGGTVLPVRHVTPVTLRRVIENHGATTLAITPSHLDMINAAGITRHTMTCIMTAGELLRTATAARTRHLFGPACTILCQWGPTETTIVNTSHTYDPATDTAAGVPFGRPMDNNTVHLLDPQGRHVPPGTPGEAWVGGTQLARGYLGRPHLTRQQFTRLADGTRIYRTGDIARLTPAGDLAFITRADDQVKINGHRIEPAEITATLQTHPAITAAAVIPRTRPGNPRKELCAYIVTTPGTDPAHLTPAAITTWLTTRLPPYMIPATITTVPAIGHTPNGKTDTATLPDPFTTPAATTTPPPGRDPLTTAIANIWARTLSIDPHTIDDHTPFHHLGATSLHMITMINEIATTLTPRTPQHFLNQLPHIIRNPTLHNITHHTRQTQQTHNQHHKLEPQQPDVLTDA
jgi:amino acid adenylation domain-containing protein